MDTQQLVVWRLNCRVTPTQKFKRSRQRRLDAEAQTQFRIKGSRPKRLQGLGVFLHLSSDVHHQAALMDKPIPTVTASVISPMSLSSSLSLPPVPETQWRQGVNNVNPNTRLRTRANTSRALGEPPTPPSATTRLRRLDPPPPQYQKQF